MESEQQISNTGYYKERVLRVTKWKLLYEDILKKLKSTTVILYLMWFYDDMVQFLDDSVLLWLVFFDCS